MRALFIGHRGRIRHGGRRNVNRSRIAIRGFEYNRRIFTLEQLPFALVEFLGCPLFRGELKRPRLARWLGIGKTLQLFVRLPLRGWIE